jgi:hypothetical protein
MSAPVSAWGGVMGLLILLQQLVPHRPVADTRLLPPEATTNSQIPKSVLGFTRAVDPDPLNPDPDPEFQVNPEPGCYDQKLKKKITEENLKNLFLIKNCNLLMSKLHEKPSALSPPALQKMKFVR